MECPNCQKELIEKGGKISCPDCARDFLISYQCQVCGSVPEEISSCGSVGYFCGTCNALRSRTSMKKEFTTLVEGA
jgi:hypothetical protein